MLGSDRSPPSATPELKLATAALAEARDQVIEASRLKSEFLAMMTHEIRTPLAGIIGMADLLLETPLVGEQRDFASIIRRQADSLLDTLNDILDFSRLEAGRLQLDDGEIEVAALLAEAVTVLTSQLRAKGIEIRQTIAPVVPARVGGDAHRLRQILINLLSNSVKFTERGSIGIEVDVVTESASEVTLRFQVRDIGIGISAQVLRRLFQPFSPGDSSARRRYSGTGLGLAISKRLVELMGGDIGVESVDGQGSMFWFRIPCRRQTAHPEPAAATRVEPASDTLAAHGSPGANNTLDTPTPG
ncbi:MAG TPA: ATP-binding protein, partial [Chloroflexota bacterium]